MVAMIWPIVGLLVSLCLFVVGLVNLGKNHGRGYTPNPGKPINPKLPSSPATVAYKSPHLVKVRCEAETGNGCVSWEDYNRLALENEKLRKVLNDSEYQGYS